MLYLTELTDFLAKLLVGVAVAALALWCLVALETYRTLRLARASRELRRRCRRLVAALRRTRSDRDRWRAEAVRWEAAYWTAVGHEGDRAHPTLQQPALKLVPVPKEDDAPVP